MSLKNINIIILVALGLGGRFALYTLCEEEDLARQLVVFWHLIFILLAVISGLIKDRSATLGEMIKSGVQNAGKYALVIGIALFIYYKWINTGYFPQRIAEIINGSEVETPEKIERMRAAYVSFFTPGMYSTLSVMGLLLMGTFYAVLGALAIQKLPIFSKMLNRS
ncbi:MAG: hypothetical protein ACI9YL_001621 [Luteibaculaceae bacterium]|jgi:hypothetical protein